MEIIVRQTRDPVCCPPCFIYKTLRGIPARRPATLMRSAKALLSAGLAAIERGEPAAAVECFRELAETHPADKRAILTAAAALRACGQLKPAALVLDRAVAAAPQSRGLLDALANAYVDIGATFEAARVLERIARIYENIVAEFPEACHLIDLGRVRTKLDQWDQAEEAYRRAMSADPKDAGAALHLGALLMTRGRLAEARDALQRAIALDPSDALAHLNAARVHLRLGAFDAAAAASRQALEIAPDLTDAHQILGTALLEAGHPLPAIASLTAALAQKPGAPSLLINLAKAEMASGRAAAAKARLTQVLADDPDNAAARALLDGRDDDLTKALLQRAWSADTIHAYAEARRHYEAALERSPGHVFALSRLLTIHGIEGRLAEADACHRELLYNLGQANLDGMNWTHLAPIAYQAVLRPMPHALLRSVAAAIDRQLPGPQAPRAQAHRTQAATGARLKVGYLSSMLRDHPIGHVTAALFAAHDRSRFEVHVFYLPQGAETPFTRTIAAGAEHFVALPPSAEGMIEAISACDLDILVYLDGYMTLALLPVVAARPARTQAFWLGHAGHCELSSLDCLIADATVVPPGEDALYGARVVRLPDTYHCASPHPIGAPMTRAEAGLPPEGFVFCAFNNPEKIDTAAFDAWMRILGRVEGSVLWLSRTLSPAVAENLRAAAAKRGVDGRRLVFADRLPDKARHLARHYLCDLFLDTFTLNASTTALDALWSGLPILTVAGHRFGARIAESFLRAVGLDGMIAADLAAYEERAVHLATHPEALSAIHAQLAENLETYPLFDIDRFARALEARLAEISRHGGPADRP